MAADLTNTRRKLAAAKEEFDTLKGEVAAYLDPAPWRLIEETHRDSYDTRWHIDRTPDSDWEIAFGKVGDEARGALDYLVRQLVVASGNEPGRTRTQFPIFRDRDEYVKKRGKRPSYRDSMLQGVDERFRRVIDDVQPYQRSRRVDNHPLAILDTVTNRHKHRDLHVALAATTGTRFRLVFSDGRVYTVRINKSDDPLPIVHGEQFLGIGKADLAPGNDIKLEIDETNTGLFFEGDDNRRFSLDDLDRSLLKAAQIVTRLSKMV